MRSLRVVLTHACPREPVGGDDHRVDSPNGHVLHSPISQCAQDGGDQPLDVPLGEVGRLPIRRERMRGRAGQGRPMTLATYQEIRPQWVTERATNERNTLYLLVPGSHDYDAVLGSNDLAILPAGLRLSLPH